MGINKHGVTQKVVATKLMKLGGFHESDAVAKIFKITKSAAGGHIGRIANSDKYRTEYKSKKGTGSRKNIIKVISFVDAKSERTCMRQAFINLICFKKPLEVA